MMCIHVVLNAQSVVIILHPCVLAHVQLALPCIHVYAFGIHSDRLNLCILYTQIHNPSSGMGPQLNSQRNDHTIYTWLCLNLEKLPMMGGFPSCDHDLGVPTISAPRMALSTWRTVATAAWCGWPWTAAVRSLVRPWEAEPQVFMINNY